MKETDNNILLFQRIIPAYRAPVFLELAKRYKITFCYSRHNSASSLKNASDINELPARMLPCLYYNSNPTSVIQNPVPVLRDLKPDVVISEGAPSYLTLWILLLLRPIFGYKLAIWSHGIKFNEINNPYRSISGKMQLWLFNRSDACIIYSDHRAAILKNYINQPDKVFTARNTLDTINLKKLYSGFVKKGKEYIKKELNFTNRYNLIFIGRLVPQKRINYLIEAFRMISGKYDIALRIIGNGPEYESLRNMAAGIKGVSFLGQIFDEQLTGKMLYASDLMVMPGYIGLSVVHAFAFGCPVVTFDGTGKDAPKHSPEVEYIINGRTGILTSPGFQNLAAGIIRLLDNPDVIESMSDEAVDFVYNHATVEKMMDGFSNAIHYLSSQKVKTGKV